MSSPDIDQLSVITGEDVKSIIPEFERVLSDSSYMVLKGHAKITEKPYSIRG